MTHFMAWLHQVTGEKNNEGNSASGISKGQEPLGRPINREGVGSSSAMRFIGNFRFFRTFPDPGSNRSKNPNAVNFTCSLDSFCFQDSPSLIDVCESLDSIFRVI
jgi:hypothetical protein